MKLLVAVPAQHGLKCLNDLQKKENVTTRKKKASHYTEKKGKKEGKKGGRIGGERDRGRGKEDRVRGGVKGGES